MKHPNPLQTVFTRSEKTSANNLYCYVLIKICRTLKYLSAVGSCPASGATVLYCTVNKLRASLVYNSSLDLSLNQYSTVAERAYIVHINSINRENPISVLYSTYFHPQRTTFPPFPRPLWVAPAHPERTGAALDSSKANAPPWYFSAARPRGRSGETTAP